MGAQQTGVYVRAKSLTGRLSAARLVYFRLQIDGGVEVRLRWGEDIFIPLAPGHHVLRGFYHWTINPLSNVATIEIDVIAGQILKCEYRNSWITYLPGHWKALDPNTPINGPRERVLIGPIITAVFGILYCFAFTITPPSAGHLVAAVAVGVPALLIIWGSYSKIAQRLPHPIRTVILLQIIGSTLMFTAQWEQRLPHDTHFFIVVLIFDAFPLCFSLFEVVMFKRESTRRNVL